MTLIELDRLAPPDQQPETTLPPAHRYRTAGLVLILVLVTALGGAAAPGALRWHYLGAVPVSLTSESPFRLDGDRVYAITGDDSDRVISAWSAGGPPRELWTTRFPARVIGPDQVAYGSVGVERTGDVVLLSDGPEVTAVDAATGVRRWTSPIAVDPLADGRTGLAEEPLFRAGTIYDQDSGDPGALFFSGTGEPHTEPPTTTRLHGIDLSTGKTSWTVSEPGSVEVFEVPAGVLVLAVDKLTLLSASTGAVLRQEALPTVDGVSPSSGQVVGGLLLVTYGADDARSRALVAYGLNDLRRRWVRAESPVGVASGSCFDVICADENGGHVVLDAATGRALWRVPDGISLTRSPTSVVELSAPDRPVRLADPANGNPRIALSGTGMTAPDGTVLMRRALPAGAASFELVGESPVALHVLGRTQGATSGCSATERLVVCQAGRRLELYAYRN